MNLVLPYLDKHSSFYSSYVTGLRQVILERDLSLEKAVELLLPLAWLTTSSRMYPIFRRWWQEDIPTSNNYTVLFIETMVKEHGSLTSGEGARYQPSFNFSVRLSEIEAGLRILYETIVAMNKMEIEPGDPKLYRRLKEIVGVGDLGALHLISIATLAGIVIHPIYATKAFVCKGTRTFDKIHQQYGCLLYTSPSPRDQRGSRMPSSA